MNIISFQRTAKVGGCVLLSGALLTPSLVWAASPGYAGFVKQLPSVYSTPPSVNVMFTMDNSSSMKSESIPDYNLSGADYSSLPTSYYSFNDQWASMWFEYEFIRKDTYLVRQSKFMAYNYYVGPAARYLRSASGNPLYYDPTITYLPWPIANNNQQRMPAANPTRVVVHFAVPDMEIPLYNRTAVPNVLDLTRQLNDSGNRYWPAAYYVYTGNTPLPLARPDTPLNVESNFIRYEIPGNGSATFPRASSRTDCTGPVGPAGCSRDKELQNFANWLQYYRSRSLMAKGGSAAAFASQGSNLRVGFARVGDGIELKMRHFSGTDRANFFTELYSTRATDNTPLREIADTVGEYFTTRNVDSPWAEVPGTRIGTEYSCRRSFHFLSTDGYWNGNEAATRAARANNDAFSGNTPAKPDGTTYSYTDTGSSQTDPLVGRFTVNPFIDRAHRSGTLSDVTSYYWKTDLRQDLDNALAPTTRDPAFWQHLTTFTIGLGITGSGGVTLKSGGTADLSTQAARDLLVANKTELNWTVPNDDNAATGDDLIHAAMSARGRNFSATDSRTLAAGLTTALAEVADQPMTLAGVAADSPQVRSDRNLYQVTVNPNTWSGRLYSFSQTTNGIISNKPTDSDYTNPGQDWEASNVMPSPDNRNIYTLTSATGPGVPFLWGNLSSAQQGSLKNDSTLLDYLRGSGTHEFANGGLLRDRTRYTIGNVTGGVLGDIVNSSPLKGPSFGGGYERLPSTDSARTSYEDFRTKGNDLDNMRNTLFVGANDGMLHAFDSTNGVERFAYVPNAVYRVQRSTSGQLPENKLALLTEPSYTHRFTVDGPPNIGDAYIGNRWRSILSASNGAGARGVFTLDVTQTAVNSGGFGANSIKWEFTEAQDTDVGFVPAYPHIVRLRNGQWAALFGNGADSLAGKAKLFVINLDTGRVIRTFEVGTPGDNGLMQPNFVLNSEREVTTVYAGDLKGNLWKFDLDDPNPSNWKTAFAGQPLFTAINAGGQSQVISVMPEITAHPQGGAMLVFGTGKLFEDTDTQGSGVNVNLLTQSIYGVWDKPGTTSTPAQPITMSRNNRSTVLQSQTAPPRRAATFSSSSRNAPDWSNQLGWYMDLDTGGERVNLPAQQVKDVVFLVANSPETNPCGNGGMSRVFALDPVTGRVPDFVVFDVNNDGKFDPATENGLNVKFTRFGILTQPIFQLPTQATYSAPLVGTTPFAIFDRGQATSARAGGVELSRSAGGTVSVPNPCILLMNASYADTDLAAQNIQTCSPVTSGGGRISWRQLR